MFSLTGNSFPLIENAQFIELYFAKFVFFCPYDDVYKMINIWVCSVNVILRRGLVDRNGNVN